MVLDSAVSYLEAGAAREMDVGTEIIFVGEVMNADFAAEQRDCMTYEYCHQVKVCSLAFRASGQVQTASGNRRGVGSARTLCWYRRVLQFVR